MIKKSTELDFDDRAHVNLFQVYVVWSGIGGGVHAHDTIMCICTDEEVAKKRVHGHRSSDQEFHDKDALVYWYEPVFLDHLVGGRMIEKAREIKRKMQTSD